MKALTNRVERSGARMPFGAVSAGVKEPGLFAHAYQCGLPQMGWDPGRQLSAA